MFLTREDSFDDVFFHRPHRLLTRLLTDLAHERGPAAAARGAAAAADGAREHHVELVPAGEVCKRVWRVSVVRRGVRGLLFRVHGQEASHHHGIPTVSG